MPKRSRLKKNWLWATKLPEGAIVVTSHQLKTVYGVNEKKCGPGTCRFVAVWNLGREKLSHSLCMPTGKIARTIQTAFNTWEENGG